MSKKISNIIQGIAFIVLLLGLFGASVSFSSLCDAVGIGKGGGGFIFAMCILFFSGYGLFKSFEDKYNSIYDKLESKEKEVSILKEQLSKYENQQ